MNRMEITKGGYVCGTAWDDEIGYTEVTVYPSIDALKEEQGCTDECGIYEIAVKFVRVVQEPTI